MKHLLCLVIYLFFVACGSKNNSANEESSKIIAKAGKENLSLKNYNEIFISTGNNKDSLKNRIKTIENWASESIFFQEAISKLNSNEINIEKLLEDYKKTLVNYIYQTKIIESNLDTNVNKKEIEKYYNDHRDNFILKDNIIKLDFVKIPLKSTALEKIKKLHANANVKDREQLKNLYIQNAENFFVNDSTWLYLDYLKREVPNLKDLQGLNLTAGKTIEFTDNTYYYYIKIKDIKIKNGISPLNFERQTIKNFIINTRKAKLIIQYKKSLLDDARNNKNFITY